MYRLIKDTGHSASVILMNTETKESVMIGNISVRMLSTLEESGISLSPEDLREIWNISLPEETGKKLAREAMKISKPKRTKKESMNEVKQEIDNEDVKQSEHTDKEPVDALSLIFGITD